MAEVYGWLSWDCLGTTRGMTNRPFDAVLLRRDGGNQGVPPGGWAAPEDAAEGRTPPPVGERAEAMSVGGGPLPCSPLTAKS